MRSCSDVLLGYFDAVSYKASFTTMIYKSADSSPRHWNLVDLLGCSILSLIISYCFSTIIVCELKALQQMKNCGAHMSNKTKDLNRQLFITLGLQVQLWRQVMSHSKNFKFQTLLPLITMYLPVGSSIISPVFGIELGVNANKIGAFVGIYPALGPLIAIKDFRNLVMCKKAEWYEAIHKYRSFDSW